VSSRPMTEGLIVLELLEELRVVNEKRGDHPLERLVVLDSRILAVGVHFGVLVGLVGGNLGPGKRK
jgi:hypothetical protein